MLGSIFEMIPKESIDKLAEQWATESRNIVLLSGSNFSVETAIAFTYKVSKYFMGADAKLISARRKKIKQFHLSSGMTVGINSLTLVHAVFTIFFNSFALKHVVVDHDQSSVHIEIDLVEDEVESMKRYLESIQEDIKKIKST